jgi:hypothetical protein
MSDHVTFSPYRVLEPHSFDARATELLDYLGMSPTLAWRDHAEAVRKAMEQKSPTKLLRYVHKRMRAEAVQMAWVFSVIALAVKLPLGRVYRNAMVDLLDMDPDAVISPLSLSAETRRQVQHMRDLLKVYAPHPRVEFDFTKPVLSSLEPPLD